MAPPSTLDTDDLDDLDDVLSEFSRQPAPPTPSSAIPTSPLSPPPPPPPTATASTFTSGRPRTNTRVDAPPMPAPGNGLPTLGEGDGDEDANPDALAADFARELAKGMESLMREIAAESTAGQSATGEATADSDEAADAARFKAAWEAMLVQEMDASGSGLPQAGASAASSGAGASTAAADGDFQAKIRAAMNKVNEGESTLQQSTSDSSAGAGPDSLEALLAQLNELGGENGDVPASEAELAGFLENMMGELMSKEVLYEPLMELADKVRVSASLYIPSFPPLSSLISLPSSFFILVYKATLTHTYSSPRTSHRTTRPPRPPLSEEDRTRYESQLTAVRSILAIFDDPSFDDNDKEKREKVVGLMAEMQSHGSPPPELMGPLPPGLGALGEEGCVLC
ncbi:hypothetical protein MVEN_02584600 [Mycena venus]|uniref:Peroxin 19 n=1 Tax=Mycena venus TaxID=2733690 RepID=A0A8H6U1M6_9AGAR|nr:hypothetical protein MVEN_02584600 [Mycena venus]